MWDSLKFSVWIFLSNTSSYSITSGTDKLILNLGESNKDSLNYTIPMLEIIQITYKYTPTAFKGLYWSTYLYKQEKANMDNIWYLYALAFWVCYELSRKWVFPGTESITDAWSASTNYLLFCCNSIFIFKLYKFIRTRIRVLPCQFLHL